MMKKLFAILLAGILCLSCIPALAEIDLTGVTVDEKLDVSKNLTIDKTLVEKLPEESASSSSEFTVETSSDAVIVKYKNMKIELDRVTGNGLICLTPNYFASIADYSKMASPEALHETILSNGLAMIIVDYYSDFLAFVYPQDASMITEMVGNLSDLSTADQGYIAEALGFEKDELVSAKNNAWIAWNENAVTIAGGQYLKVETANSTSFDDILYLLNALKVTDIE